MRAKPTGTGGESFFDDGAEIVQFVHGGRGYVRLVWKGRADLVHERG